MIDAFVIILSGAMCVLVVIRAVKLDRTLPWFQLRPDQPPASPGTSGKWQGRAYPVRTPPSGRPGPR